VSNLSRGLCVPVAWVQVFQQYVQYVREKQGVSQAEEDLVAGLQVREARGSYAVVCAVLCSTALCTVWYSTAQ
jgi:hypothetical protein